MIGNPFDVSAGILPFPAAAAAQINVLSSTFGVTNGLQRFDANLFQRQPLTIMIQLPPAVRNLFDLRINNIGTDVQITPIDSFGNTLPSTGITGNQLAPNLLYVSKNVFDAGCGAANTCLKLPACNNILGCDGFSVPSSFLSSRINGNGFQFQISYRVGLTNSNGSPPNAAALSSRRRLLQLSSSNNGDVTFAFVMDESAPLDTPEFRSQCTSLFRNQAFQDNVRAFTSGTMVAVLACFFLAFASHQITAFVFSHFYPCDEHSM